EFALSKSVKPQAYDDIDYSEPLRPQFHFSSGRNWINDPNGMVYDGEKYHLFFQHNPRAPLWGNMTWGHAVSSDMVHWKQVEHALVPYRVDGRSGTIFSGTAVVDRNNSLGVQKGDVPTLCAFFTFATQPKFYQAMAYSTDRGKTWTYWNEGRPVIENQGFDSGERDPKVFWHEASEQWVMALWVQQNPGRVRFFTSPNLTDWTFASDLMRDWAFECMDLAFIPVDGDPARTKAVLYDASFDYEFGMFDGKEFHTEAGPFRAGGGNFYAAQTFNNQPQQRTVQIGWMRGGPNPAETYGLPYNGQMSFPCELTLKTTESGVRLFAWPIREIESLVRKTHTQSDVALGAGEKLLADLPPLDLVDMEIDFSPGSAKQLACRFRGISITYDCEMKRLQFSGVRDNGEPEVVTAFDELAPRDGSAKLRVLIDRLSVELYAFDGERFFAGYYSPKQGDGTQSIQALGGDAVVNHLVVRELNSAWTGQKHERK
ncbi:MAG: glycoside hydrolase family 32 protein, partial [Pirellulales bacterium]